jgi:hypothetical protein
LGYQTPNSFGGGDGKVLPDYFLKVHNGAFDPFGALKARFSGRGTCSPGSLAPGGAAQLLPDYFLNFHHSAAPPGLIPQITLASS